MNTIDKKTAIQILKIKRSLKKLFIILNNK